MNLAQAAAKILARDPSAGRKAIAKILGVKPNGELRRVLERLKASQPVARPATTTEPAETREFRQDTAELSTRRKNVRTLAELLSYMKVDLAVWEVERHVINKWEVGAKDEDSKVQVTPLYQVKAWLRRKSPARPDTALRALLAEFRTHAPRRTFPAVARKPEGHLLELDIFDPHIGKLCWQAETGSNYDIKIALAAYRRAVTDLIAKTRPFGISRIVYPIGNDFFHVDNSHNTTTGGTPQDVDGRWQKSFIEGRQAILDTIHQLRTIAPLDIIMVGGNHDMERIFYFGEVLAGWTHRTDGITVNNGLQPRKYYQWGENLIGYTHGNEERIEKLSILMATEAAKPFAATRFREFHCGHIHRERQLAVLVNEENAIRTRFFSSLTPPDYWHKKKGYEGLRAANAILWHKTAGPVAQINHHVGL